MSFDAAALDKQVQTLTIFYHLDNAEDGVSIPLV
jgi:hypothetical protein